MKIQTAFTGDFYESAIARERAARCQNTAVEPSHIISPDDNFSSVSRCTGTGIDHRVFADIGPESVLDFSILALKIAADEGCAATCITRYIHHRVVEQADLLTQHMNRAALLA